MQHKLILLGFVLLFGCSENIIDNLNLLINEKRVTISQGVWGNVQFWEGDFMPSIGSKPRGKITPVVREIYIHEAARHSDVVYSSTNAVFIKQIKTKLVKKISSDKMGFFQTKLEPGIYSFFVKEDSLYFASETSGDGYLMAAGVKENTVSKRQININYKAVY